MSENNINDTELSKKVSLALSDIQDDGGYLLPEQSGAFIQRMLDSSTFLNEVQYKEINSPSGQYFPKLSIGTSILRNDDTDGTIISDADEVKVTTEQFLIKPSDFKAQVVIPYKTLRDNIEGQALQDTILSYVSKKVQLDIERMIIHGNPAATVLASQVADMPLGVIKKQKGLLAIAAGSNAHTVDAGNIEISREVLSAAIKAMPDKYMATDMNKFYMNRALEEDFRLASWDRVTVTPLVDQGKMSYSGVPVARATFLPKNVILLFNPKLFYFGVYEKMSLEYFRDTQKGFHIFTMRLSLGFAFEEEDAVVRITNVAEKGL